MKDLEWNEEKNLFLKEERNISFETFIPYIETKKILDVVAHPNQEKYPGQKMYLIEVNDYVWMVPFVEDDEKIFLKTAIPSRKATKTYLRKS